MRWECALTRALPTRGPSRPATIRHRRSRLAGRRCSVRPRMDPQPPPLDGWPPSSPPLLFGTPQPPPAWPPTTSPEASSQTHALRWIAGAGTILAVAGVLIVALVGWHPPGSAASAVARQTTSPTTSASAPSTTTAPATAIPSVAPVSAAVAEAGRQYLAAVAPVNADGAQLTAALDADEALPCTCSPGEFEIRADTLAVIPVDQPRHRGDAGGVADDQTRSACRSR